MTLKQRYYVTDLKGHTTIEWLNVSAIRAVIALGYTYRLV